MPTSARDSVQFDVLYPDELPGAVMRIRDHEKLNGEVEFWDADDPDDRDDLPGGTKPASYGWWLPVEHSEHGDVWVASPRALREGVFDLDLDIGDCFEVTDVVEGDEEHDPYELVVHETEPDGRPE